MIPILPSNTLPIYTIIILLLIGKISKIFRVTKSMHVMQLCTQLTQVAPVKVTRNLFEKRGCWDQLNL